MSKYRQLRILISGGGTGGHIFPAISIADEMRRLNPDSEILFVGAEGKMEMEKVPAAGYRIVGLPISGLQRKLSLRNMVHNLALPFKTLYSRAKARKLIREFKPDIAVGVGGYASAPLLMAATRAHIPSIIQEQNGFAGLTNKMLGGKVDRICVAYEGMERFFPAEKIVLTGNPVRRNLLECEASAEDAKKALGIDDLRFELEEDRITFPWFAEPQPKEATAYTHFIAALCRMSKDAKRITAKEKPVDNEKYAFRCFLLRLGFIGDAYKTDRKILLRNLSGSSAFKSGKAGVAE